MTHRVLISAPYMLPSIERFRVMLAAHGTDVVAAPVQERLEEEELLALIPGIHGVMCGDDRFTEAVFRAAAPTLRVVSKWGTGIDSIDLEAARRHGVTVCNTPGAFTEPVADTVLGYMLSFARQIPWSTEVMRHGAWDKIPGFTLREKTLGIIGVGDIGKAVAGRARAFGMRILGTDIKPIDAGVIDATGLEVVSLLDLLAQSDYVTLHTDLNSTSRHLLNPNTFPAIKRGAFVINTSRGPVIDEAALIAALSDGRLGGAALDVFEHEPLPLDSPLRRMPNVLLAAHNANTSPAAWEAVHQNTVRNLLRGLGISV